MEFLRAIDGVAGHELSRFTPPPDSETRSSAVLILFGEGPHGPDVLLIERAADMRSHAGQPAFPGGGVDPDDDGPVAAALREAQEETGLEPAGVTVARVLPDLWLPPSGYTVTPVIGYWSVPAPVWAADPREVARAERIPLAQLVDPAQPRHGRAPLGLPGSRLPGRGHARLGLHGRPARPAARPRGLVPALADGA